MSAPLGFMAPKPTPEPDTLPPPVAMLSSGKLLNLLEPDPALLTIEVIARGLARECRFGRMTNGWLSVAEHSINVSKLVRPGLRRAALLHDAPEFILGDIISPLKKHLPDYRLFEDRLAEAVAMAHRFPSAAAFSHPEIKAADAAAAWAEARYTMPHGPGMPEAPEDENMREMALDLRIRCFDPTSAERNFLNEWNRTHWVMDERQKAA